MGGGPESEQELPMHDVLESCRWIVSQASSVTLRKEALQTILDRQHTIPKLQWNFDKVHFCDGTPLTAQYLLIVDTLNFCFWPVPEFQYGDLAGGLKRSLEKDANALDAERLAVCDGLMLRNLLQWPGTIPLEEERVMLVREVGRALVKNFSGQAANLINAAEGSAIALVELVTAYLPGFRDHCVYRGRQVFLYKRAQIFVADIWGAFQGQGLGGFRDIDRLTMFADYLVPAVFRKWGVLEYIPELAAKVDRKEEVLPGTEEEVEIRAACVVATDELRTLLEQKTQEQIISIQLDWWLWSQGAALENLVHHRTRTIYY